MDRRGERPQMLFNGPEWVTGAISTPSFKHPYMRIIYIMLNRIGSYEYRRANQNDIELLASMNLRLIQDEGHQNEMGIPELVERMSSWTSSEYSAILFEDCGNPVGYVLWRDDGSYLYIRQFFIDSNIRRSGQDLERVFLTPEDLQTQ